jgi:hypothetical protein
MIHGLIKHHNLNESVMNLRAPAEEFKMPQGALVSTADWNPLLIAIASKKIEVVQYFLGHMKISLRHLGRVQEDESYSGLNELAQK